MSDVSDRPITKELMSKSERSALTIRERSRHHWLQHNILIILLPESLSGDWQLPAAPNVLSCFKLIWLQEKKIHWLQEKKIHFPICQ